MTQQKGTVNVKNDANILNSTSMIPKCSKTRSKNRQNVILGVKNNVRILKL